MLCARGDKRPGSQGEWETDMDRSLVQVEPASLVCCSACVFDADPRFNPLTLLGSKGARFQAEQHRGLAAAVEPGDSPTGNRARRAGGGPGGGDVPRGPGRRHIGQDIMQTIIGVIGHDCC